MSPIGQGFPCLSTSQRSERHETAAKDKSEIPDSPWGRQSPSHEHKAQERIENRGENYVSWCCRHNTAIAIKHVVIGLHRDLVVPFTGQAMTHVNDARLAKAFCAGFARA
jgi:hypothetical protein